MGTLLSDVKWQHTGKFGRLNTMPIPAKDVLQKIGKTAMREWKKQGDYFTRDNMLSSDEILRQCIG